MFAISNKVKYEDEDKDIPVITEIGGKVDRVEVNVATRSNSQHNVSFKFTTNHDNESMVITGTSAELFNVCKKIIDTIYKDKPMQKAIARANLMEK